MTYEERSDVECLVCHGDTSIESFHRHGEVHPGVMVPLANLTNQKQEHKLQQRTLPSLTMSMVGITIFLLLETENFGWILCTVLN